MQTICKIPVAFSVYGKTVQTSGNTFTAGVVSLPEIQNLISPEASGRTWTRVSSFSQAISKPYNVGVNFMQGYAYDAQGNSELVCYRFLRKILDPDPHPRTYWGNVENNTIDTPYYENGNCWASKNYCMFAIAVYTDNAGENLGGFQFVMCEEGSNDDFYFNPATTDWQCFINLKHLKSLGFELDMEDFDPDINEDPNEPEGYGVGGGPAHNHNSDTIGMPAVPDVATSSTGFTHVYKVTTGGLAGIGQYLFPAIQNITDIESALRTIAGIFGYRDNIQYVVDLHAIPGSPTVGSSSYIKIGSLETDISAPVVSSDYYDFDCGSITIPECYANYIDYIGTSLKLYLPFVGMVDLEPSLVMGGVLSVKYRFNVVDGSFMCFVIATSARSKLANTVIAQYGGSACIHLPVVANSYGALVSGLVSGAALAAASANPAIGIASAATSVMSQQPAMQSSNNYNSSTSFLGVRRPYVIIKRQWPAMATGYGHDKGLPLNYTTKIGNVHGYTEIENIDLSGIGATQAELDELKSILASGVYL